jgi:hypothetical protein
MANNYKTIAVFEYSYQAQILKGRLEADGIPVYLGDLYSVEAEPGASQAMGGVKLKVKAEDVIRAKHILSSLKVTDEDAHVLICPQCESVDIEHDTTVNGTSDLWANLKHFFSNLLLDNPKMQYRCTNCNTKFIQ